MNVLSLFDGISCGMIALERSGVKVDRYDAYEIDENAIYISNKNYPQINHYGDVTNAVYYENQYDLVIGGSPCQSLSSCNITWKGDAYGINGSGPSVLFWEYVRAIKTIKPKYFLFENVGSMKKDDKRIISEQLGVEPISINSSLFSAQNRNRLYWTNIPVDIPTERINIFLKDVLESDVPDKYYLSEKMYKFVTNTDTGKWVVHDMRIDLDIARPICASCWKQHRASQDNYVTGNRKPLNKTNVRRLTPLECERLQTLPDNYTIGIKDEFRYKCIGNGWTVDVISYIFRGLK